LALPPLCPVCSTRPIWKRSSLPCISCWIFCA